MVKENKIYTWNEITVKYPDSWVIITDIKESNGEIQSCKLLDVCTKENKYLYIQKYLKTGLKFECQRTTFKAPNIGTLS